MCCLDFSRSILIKGDKTLCGLHDAPTKECMWGVIPLVLGYLKAP